MKLEELARQSSASARVSVSRLEAPPIGGVTPNRPWMPILAGVAVTALVVGGLAVLARDRSDGDSAADAVLPTVAEVPRLGLELDGWSVTYAGSFEDLGPGRNRPNIFYYGDADNDDPFANGDLLIAANPGADPSSVTPEAPGGETIEVRGTEATVSSSTDLGLPTDATSLTWYESNVDGTATEIVLVSRSFDVDRLIEIAEALSIDGDIVTPGDDLELDRLAIAGSPFDVLSGSDDGYFVGYTNESSSDFVVISSTPGSLEQGSDVMSWWTGDVAAVEVDGRPGFLATFDESMPDLGPMLSWSPVDGVVTTLSRLGTDASLDLVALAGTAYEIDDVTWAGYLTAAEAIRTGTDQFDEIFGEGKGTVGETEYSWVLGLQDDNLCFDLQTGNESNGSCQQRDPLDVPAGGARTVDNSFGAVVATVVIAADPTVEQVVETQARYSVTRVEADGVAWFVAIGDTNIQPSFDVIVDGTVVATLEAAVEAVADMEPPLASNPAATELGIADMTILAADDTSAGFSWWLGSTGPDLCLVTDGAEPTARCSAAGDIVVFAPVAAPDNELTFVVVVDAPSCVAGISFDGPTVEFSAGAADELHTYEIFGIIDNSDTAKLRFDGGGASQPVDLPGFEGTATFPPQLCDG